LLHDVILSLAWRDRIIEAKWLKSDRQIRPPQADARRHHAALKPREEMLL
jgi:hypothetical protein